MSRFGVVRAAFLVFFIPTLAFAQAETDLVECGSATAADPTTSGVPLRMSFRTR